MSTTTPDTTSTPAGPTITLPPGVTLGAFRETSQTNSQGQIVQGVLFPVTFANGSTSTVFIPYSALGNQQQIQDLFDARLQGLAAIAGV